MKRLIYKPIYKQHNHRYSASERAHHHWVWREAYRIIFEALDIVTAELTGMIPRVKK